MIDLRAIAKRRGYRTALDASYWIEKEEFRKEERPWHWQVPCELGHLFVMGRETIGAYCRSRKTMDRLLAIPGVTKRQGNDSEANVAVPLASLDAACEVMKPLRRRAYSPEYAAKLAERVRPFRFPAPRGVPRPLGTTLAASLMDSLAGPTNASNPIPETA